MVAAVATRPARSVSARASAAATPPPAGSAFPSAAAGVTSTVAASAKRARFLNGGRSTRPQRTCFVVSRIDFPGPPLRQRADLLAHVGDLVGMVLAHPGPVGSDDFLMRRVRGHAKHFVPR